MIDQTVDTKILRSFIFTNFYVPADQPLDDTMSFLQLGIIDSTGVLELVAFVEKELGVTVHDDELVPSNFDSIAAIADFIRRKRSAAHVLGH
jgi:acyl carrier protein